MSHKIALLLPDWIEYCHLLAVGVRRFASRHKGFQVQEFGQEGEWGASPRLFRWKPDGVIIFADNDESELLRSIRSLHAPIVNTSSGMPHKIHPSVHVDPSSVVQAALDHFETLGLHRVAFVGMEDHIGTTHRAGEMTAQAKRRGWVCRVCRLEYYVHYDEREPALDKLLANAAKPLGVLGYDDTVADFVCRIAQEKGLQVPEDVAIVGAGDSNTCLSCDPHLSSVRFPGEQVGYKAAELLATLIDGKPPPPRPIKIAVPGVAVRESTRALTRDGLDVEQAIAYVYENATKGVTVDSLLRLYGVSRPTLDKQFIQQLGHTAAKEIHRVRMERAKELLRDTDLTITRIAGLCGFSSSSQFSIVFRDAIDQTPSEFRDAEANG